MLRSRTHNPALMSLAFASGLRARIRLDGDTVVVTVGVEGLKPLTTVPEPPAGPGARAGAASPGSARGVVRGCGRSVPEPSPGTGPRGA